MIFHFICFTVATIYAIQNVGNYFKNEDMVEVSFKTFHEKKEHIYPSLTMCLSSPFKQEILQKYSSNLTIPSYESYLTGGYGYGQMSYSEGIDFSNVTYENVSIQEKDFLLNVQAKMNGHSYRSGKNLENVTIHSWGWLKGVMKCFTFDVPYQENTLIKTLEVEFDNAIFPNGQRPSDGWASRGMLLFFHYPKQFARSYSSNKRFWPVRKSGTGYKVRIFVKGMEVLRKRHKSYEECQEDMNYDDWLVKHIVKEVKCKPPYWNVADEQQARICETKEELLKATKMFMDVFGGIKEFIKEPTPCTETKKLDLEFEEQEDDSNPKNTTNRRKICSL